MSKENRVSDERLFDLLARDSYRMYQAVLPMELSSMVAELQSLRSKPLAGVEVKPLEWEEFQSDDDVLFMHSSGAGVRYEVFHKASDVETMGIQVVRFERHQAYSEEGDDAETHTILGYGYNIEAAYAIAQADYRNRILSTLSLPAQEPEEDEGSRQAAVDIADAVIKWMVKHDLLDPEHEYFDHDIIEVLNDFAPAEETRILYRHQKRGTVYELIGIGKMQAENWEERGYTATDEPVAGASVDMREVAVYRSADNPDEIWVRPREEFQDGRFEALTAAALKED